VNTSLARTPDGYRIEVSRRIARPADVCWELLTDTARWPEWGPSLRAAECDDGGRFIERGTTGRVQLSVPGKPWAPFEITSCEDYRWTWTVGAPASHALRNVLDAAPRVSATGHRVEPIGETACRVVFEVPPLAAGYALVCRRALGRLARLADEHESGNEHG
jgi:hypothetical protein